MILLRGIDLNDFIAVMEMWDYIKTNYIRRDNGVIEWHISHFECVTWVMRLWCVIDDIDNDDCNMIDEYKTIVMLHRILENAIDGMGI